MTVADGIMSRFESRGQAAYFGEPVSQLEHALQCAPSGRLRGRYLCATDPEYVAQLSPASIQSLSLQGGAFLPDEAHAFESQAYFRQAVRLRRLDDAAKIPGLRVPSLDYYRSRIEAALRSTL